MPRCGSLTTQEKTMGLRFWMSATGACVAICALAPPGLAAEEVAAAPPLSHIGAPAHAVSYVFKFVPEEMAPSAHPWNSQIAEAWIYARLFDESGKQYVLMRTVRDLKSNGVTLTTDGKPDSRIPREAGDVARTVDSTAGLVFSGKEFRVALSPSAVVWTDQGGAVSLQGSGSPLGNVGTAELIPYRQQDGSTGIDIYTGQYHPVTGTLFGTAVKGMFVIDHFIGTELFGASALSSNEVVWFKFANVFADGSVEMGEMFTEQAAPHGAGQVAPMHGGSVTDGIRVIATSPDPRVTFVLNAQKEASKETWTLGKDQWEFVPDNTGVKALGKSGLVQAWGGVHRVGDKRKIVNQFAITEYNVSRFTPDMVKGSR
jgi:hypothetical protein